MDQCKPALPEECASSESGSTGRGAVVAMMPVTELKEFDMGALLETSGLAAVLKQFADVERNPLAEMRLDDPDGGWTHPCFRATNRVCGMVSPLFGSGIVQHDTWAQSAAEFQRLATGIGAIYTKKGYLSSQRAPCHNDPPLDPPFDQNKMYDGKHPLLAQRWACMHRKTGKERGDRALARLPAGPRACSHKADGCTSIIYQYSDGSKVCWAIGVRTKRGVISLAKPCSITDLLAHISVHQNNTGVTCHALMPDTAFISAMPHARSIPDEAKDTMERLRSSGMPVKEIARAMQVLHPCNCRLHPCV